MSKIVIDLGHGIGRDRGAVGVIAEETIINAVGGLVIEKLRALGNDVLTVRPSSASSLGDSLEQRVIASNDFGAELYVSIHANAGGGTGSEVFTNKGQELDQARNVLNNLVALGFRNRGIKGESLFVINHTYAKAMLVEICFVDSQSDVDLYKRIGDNAIADAIVKGITGETIAVESSSNVAANIATETPAQAAKKFVGNRCLELQKLLIAKGYNCGGYGADGYFGQGTYDSIVKFQKDNGLVADGLAGEKTFAKLKEIKAAPVPEVKSTNWVSKLQAECNAQGLSSQSVDGIPGSNTLVACPTLRIGAKGNITKLLQERLNGYGFNCGTPDGMFGSNTNNAVIQYQKSRGLDADGIVGKGTWSKLIV